MCGPPHLGLDVRLGSEFRLDEGPSAMLNRVRVLGPGKEICGAMVPFTMRTSAEAKLPELNALKVTAFQWPYPMRDNTRFRAFGGFDVRVFSAIGGSVHSSWTYSRVFQIMHQKTSSVYGFALT
jgi:hypothetical protein